MEASAPKQENNCSCHEAVGRIRALLLVFAVPISLVLLTITGFYFTTRMTLQAHEVEIGNQGKQIRTIEKDMFSKQDMKEFKKDLKDVLNEIKNDIKEIKNNK
jgi:hypothetical protein